VVQADVLEYLRSLPDESQGAITGFHIIEHLRFEMLMKVLAESHRVLKAGGFVIVESPNCKNLVVGACHFYADPTHRNPVFPDTAAFMLSAQGFDPVRIEYLTPAEGSPFDANSSGGGVLNERFYGPQDFAVIAHKGRRDCKGE
jgi:O-antigen chain-terminating methyltransferase